MLPAVFAGHVSAGVAPPLRFDAQRAGKDSNLAVVLCTALTRCLFYRLQLVHGAGGGTVAADDGSGLVCPVGCGAGGTSPADAMSMAATASAELMIALTAMAVACLITTSQRFPNSITAFPNFPDLFGKMPNGSPLLHYQPC